MDTLLQVLPKFDPVDHVLFLFQILFFSVSDLMLSCSWYFAGHFYFWPPLLTLPHCLLNVGVPRFLLWPSFYASLS